MTMCMRNGWLESLWWNLSEDAENGKMSAACSTC